MRFIRAAVLFGLCVFMMMPAARAEIKFAVTDISGLEALQLEFGAFRDALEEALGEKVSFFPLSSRTIGTEAMKEGQLDYVLTGPAEYVVFAAHAGGRPVVGWQRPYYYTQIVVREEAPFQTVEDLKGKKIAFGDVGSTSTHMAPAKLLFDHGLKSGTDYQAMHVHRSVSVEALMRGDIDAATMGPAHLEKILKNVPDARLRVLERGPDLPDDVLVAGAHVSEEHSDKMKKIFMENGERLMQAAMQGEEAKKYASGAFRPDVKDSDYDYIRGMYEAAGAQSLLKFMGE